MTDDHGWWVHIHDKSHWVPDTATLRNWLHDGRLGRSDLVWDPGTSRWIGSTDVQELRPEFYPLSPVSSRWRYDAFLVTWPLLMLIAGFAGVVLIAGTLSGGLLSTIRAILWRETEGRITRSAMSASVEHFDNGTTRTRYRVDFRYEYQVDRRRYESSRIGVSDADEDGQLLDRAAAQGVVGRYPVGDRVAVYFDPADPAAAALNRREDIIVGFGIGMGMTAIATLVLRHWWRRRREIAEVRDSAV